MICSYKTRVCVLMLVLLGCVPKCLAQMTVIDSLQNLLPEANGEQRIKTLIGISYHFLRISADSSLQYAYEALDYSRETNNDRGVARALLMIGNAYNTQGKNSLAIKNHKKALAIFNDLKDTAAIGISHNNLGIDYHDMGQYESAIDEYKQAKNIAEKSNDFYGICYATNNIGIIYEDWGKPAFALEYYKKALELAHKLNDESYIGITLQNAGVACLKLGNLDEAMDYLDQSLAINEKMGANKGIYNALINKADLFIKLRDTLKAVEIFQKALQVSRNEEDPSNICGASIKLGSIFTQKGEYDKAEPLLMRAIEIAGDLEESNLLKEAYHALSEYYRKTGNYQLALQYFTDYTDLKDSIFNRDSRREISEMQTLYELDKKEKEIEIQNLKIDRQQARFYYIVSGIFIFIIMAYLIFNRYKLKQKQARAELEKKNIDIEQRLLRTQMNPHFIFNSLNSISSFISDNNPENAQAFLSKFARLMRYILENSRKAFVPVEDDINTLQLNLELEQLRFDHRFEFDIKLDNAIDPEFTYIPPMLIQPFVENAIIHGLASKESGGKLNINIRKNDELIHCVITDNGIGREKSNELKARSGKTGHRSLGMQVTRERLSILNEKVKGDVKFTITDLHDESGNALGTEVELDFPYELE